MLVGTFDIEATAIGSCHQPGNRDVDDNADSGDDHDQTSADGRGSDQSSDSLDSDEDRDDEQCDAIDRRRNDLGSFPTPSPRSLRTTPSESHSPQGNGDGTDIRQHVTSVGEQRQRPGNDGRNDLRDHEGRQKCKSSNEVPSVRVRG